jgi:SAM-dependent methyltransferase
VPRRLPDSSVASIEADCKPGYTPTVIDPIEYDSYFVPSLFEPWSRELIRRAQVWKGDRVLDLACGTGIVACRIAGTGAKVTGVEISAPRLAQAQVRARDENVPVTFVEGDATALKFANASFDLVTCQQGLQFFADKAASAKEMRRVLASGGRAVIACWAGLADNPVYALLDGIATARLGGGYGAPFSFGDEAELLALLLGAKFMLANIETVARKVRFPEPERFVSLTLANLCNQHGGNAGAVPGAIAEAMTAIAPYIVDGGLEMMTTSRIAVARVSAE